MYTRINKLLIVAKARDDGRLWISDHDQVMLVPPFIPHLGSIGCFLHKLVGQAGPHSAAVDDHVVPFLDPEHLSIAQLRPVAAP